MAILTRRRGTMTGLALLAIAGAGIALAAGIGPQGDSSAGGGDVGASPPAAITAPAPAAPPAGEAGAGASGQVSSPAETTTRPVPPAPPVVDGEVMPAPADEPDVALPESEPLPELLPGRAPATDAKRGAMVTGFPSFVTAAPGSTVATSMVASESGRVQAALTASSTSSSADVLAHFDAAFADRDLQAADAPAVGGSSARAYTRATESVTVTVTDRADGGCDYSVLAILDAAG
jgi:hypothetical protein